MFPLVCARGRIQENIIIVIFINDNKIFTKTNHHHHDSERMWQSVYAVNTPVHDDDKEFFSSEKIKHYRYFTFPLMGH